MAKSDTGAIWEETVGSTCRGGKANRWGYILPTVRGGDGRIVEHDEIAADAAAASLPIQGEWIGRPQQHAVVNIRRADADSLFNVTLLRSC